MATDSPADIRTRFERDGYVVIPGLLDRGAVAELRRMVDGALDGSLKPDRGSPPPDDFTIQWEPRVKDADLPRREKIRVLFHLAHTHSWFWALAAGERMLDAVENLIGADIRYYTDQMFVKPARHGSEVPYHHDAAYWPNVEPRLVSCWLAVDDVTVENGCVRYIPGSHREEYPHHIADTDNPNRIGVVPGRVDERREIPVEMAAGSLCVHHCLTVHRSLPNTSARGRRGLVMIYLPADTKFIRPWPFPHGFPVVRRSAASR